MKRISIILVIILTCTYGSAQGLVNIFSQRAADLKNMGKQIALLQLYMGWIEQGYQIAGSGLHLISDIKQGEWNLHSLFFGSLALVNPAIKQCAEVTEVMQYQADITKELAVLGLIKNLNPEETDHLLEVKENLLGDCFRDLDHLISLLSDHVFRMSDEERIRSLAAIDLNMENHWKMAKELVGAVRLIALQRQRETHDVQSLKNLQ